LSGTELPIFSGAGLPANQLLPRLQNRQGAWCGENFAVVFAAMGITYKERHLHEGV
jgi:V/A-type H+-transporting ATPase subunit B